MSLLKNKSAISLWTGSSLKILSFGLKNKGGRNRFGRICSFRKGTHSKRKYRIIDFLRNIKDESAIVRRVEYDPNRTANIALVCYKNGIISYIISVDGLLVGDEICNYALDSENIAYSKGNKLCFKNIPLGSFINNVELIEDKGSQICRSAGTFCVLLNKITVKDKEYAIIRFSSGVEYMLPINCTAVLGVVSNIEHNLRDYNKAGTMRNKGIRPTVRGVAMNPVDHPHGGGEGRKSGRRAARSPWGKITRGVYTRRFTKSNKFIIKKNGKI